ncbi:MAG TPA: transketolase C-terminal domain-containing protein, partial [Bryobacteraceae bacterium]|nr:transketolase C-terminal domain-containing protein [Bryobacteraceae bacterium]
CGIAEANMVGVAAGLASAGKIPFAASFAAFAVNKAFEQMRVLAAYPNVNVKVVGTHCGISIGEDGPSQMAVEDLGLACSLPGFTVLSPADEVSMAALMRAAAAHVGPVYIRAGRLKVPVVYDSGAKFEIGKAVELTAGKDVAIIATGLMVAEAIRAQELLAGEGISARVVDFHTAKPLDRAAIQRAAAETGAIVVAEEHLADAGLGVRVAQVVAQTRPCPMEFVGVQDTYAESASPEQLLEKYGLMSGDVVSAVRRVLLRK